MTIFAFIGMCLAWGFSWFAMKLQVDSFVPVEISLFYRFFGVAICMIFLCLITKKRLKPFKTEWKYFIFIALTNFCLNFIIGYHTTKFIPSGMIAVIFSLSIITSELLKNILDNKKIDKKIILSSFIGSIGLISFISPSLKFNENQQGINIFIGILLALLMMIIFSFGNYLVEKNKLQNHTPLFSAITFGSVLSSIYLLLINLSLGYKFSMDYSNKYIYSLIYQIFISSIMAFICFYYLIQKIGTIKANYTALIYPLIAITVSAFYEDFRFTLIGTFGLILIIFALIIEFINISTIKNFLLSFFKIKNLKRFL
jgi:drug/metabolite transporter (DMT)-like permease